MLLIFRQNKSIDDDDESTGHGNGHGVRKIKITAIQQVMNISWNTLLTYFKIIFKPFWAILIMLLNTFEL